MTDKRDTAALTMREGQVAGSVLGSIDGTISALSDSVDQRIFARLVRGDKIDPQEAVQCWLEKFAYHSLRKKLFRTVRTGQHAAASLGEILE